MRLKGRVVRWDNTRGFGFVRRIDVVPGERSGREIFTHYSQVQPQRQHLEPGMIVSFELGERDGRIGQMQAVQVFVVEPTSTERAVTA